jgi:hypothetical protein
MPGKSVAQSTADPSIPFAGLVSLRVKARRLEKEAEAAEQQARSSKRILKRARKQAKLDKRTAKRARKAAEKAASVYAQAATKPRRPASRVPAPRTLEPKTLKSKTRLHAAAGPNAPASVPERVTAAESMRGRRTASRGNADRVLRGTLTQASSDSPSSAAAPPDAQRARPGTAAAPDPVEQAVYVADPVPAQHGPVA